MSSFSNPSALRQPGTPLTRCLSDDRPTTHRCRAMNAARSGIDSCARIRVGSRAWTFSDPIGELSEKRFRLRPLVPKTFYLLRLSRSLQRSLWLGGLAL
jgi:hypothetical protein